MKTPLSILVCCVCVTLASAQSPFPGLKAVLTKAEWERAGLDKLTPDQIGVTVSRMPTLAGAKKIDDYTVELTTREPDSFLPINLTNLFIASPAHWQKK